MACHRRPEIRFLPLAGGIGRGGGAIWSFSSELGKETGPAAPSGGSTCLLAPTAGELRSSTGSQLTALSNAGLSTTTWPCFSS